MISDIELQKAMIRGYEYITQKVISRTDYNYPNNPRDLKKVENFIKKQVRPKIGLSVGSRFFFTYVITLLHYRSNQNTQIGKQIVPSWIFGPKAFQQFFKLRDNKSIDFHILNGVIKKYKISYREFASVFNNDGKNDWITINEREESIKKEYYDTEQRLVHCSQNTTMYNRRSNLCLMCGDREFCKKWQKQHYPAIFRARNL